MNTRIIYIDTCLASQLVVNTAGMTLHDVLERTVKVMIMAIYRKLLKLSKTVRKEREMIVALLSLRLIVSPHYNVHHYTFITPLPLPEPHGTVWLRRCGNATPTHTANMSSRRTY